MTQSLQKNTPAWHREAAQLLKDNFGKIHAAFVDSTKRAVWMGMFLNHIKYRGDKKTGDGSIGHGEFGPWLEKNVPDITWNLANTYMRIATGACEKGKFQIVDFPQFARLGHLPPQIEKMVEGKTQQQLLLDFRGGEAKQLPAPKKLSPTEAHAEHIKNLDAHWDHLNGALDYLLQMKDVDFVLRAPIERKLTAARVQRLGKRIKESLKKQKAKI